MKEYTKEVTKLAGIELCKCSNPYCDGTFYRSIGDISRTRCPKCFIEYQRGMK